MASRKQVLQALLTKVKADLPQFQTVRVWNNQIQRERAGEYPNFAKPACFVQIIVNPEWGALPDGVSSADLGVVFHIAHEYYDNNEGDFEQDLVVFDLADKIIEGFTLHKLPACGPMTKISETQDEDHDNVYYYQVGYLCHFLDDVGAKKYIETNMVDNVKINATIKTLIP